MILKMDQVVVLRQPFAFIRKVDQQIEPAEIGVVLYESLDLVVVNGDQIGGGCEKFLHQPQLLLTKRGLRKNHRAFQHFIPALQVFFNLQLKKCKGGARVFVITIAESEM
jgi:hypothetical protein